ncbi:helix-turn-helix domain-containing protein [Photobacterium sanguinicancri]|uniref:helix-turn-helix domain-containing protein n=1 Tax=Photobacterium sanguinicancri TaxID=875932 RepID=UPI0026E1EE1B|nr:helix-turn-helix domain-containing protein [Photobacterium sanguinicancri]MDO6498162.1 helix-turn-helix domain-containing protein [Photobacterium sanguinicancri]
MSSKKHNTLPMIRTEYTRILIEVFAANGIDANKLLERSGLPPDLLRTNQDYLPVEPVKHLIYLLSYQVDNNNFSKLLRLAFRQHIIPSILGQFETAHTVHDALIQAITVFSSDSPGSQITVEESHGRFWFCRGANYEESPYFIWGEVFAILYTIELISALTQSDWHPDQVKIQHTSTEAVESAIGQQAQLFIGHDKTAILINPDVLNTELKLCPSSINRKKDLVEWHSSFSDNVFTALQPYVKEYSLTIDQAAKLLKMSSRTLQRRLKEEKTTFRQVKESLMLSASCELMRQGYSLTHIANQLGYNNISHYSRAFKKVTGLPPKSYKKALLGID